MQYIIYVAAFLFICDWIYEPEKMKKFYSKATIETPEISFDHLTGEFEITVRSFPDQAFAFYDSLFLWVDEYVMVPLKNTRLVIKIDYINTSSLKCLLEIVKKLEACINKNHKVSVEWYYGKGDEEIKETGEDFGEISGIPVSVQEIQ